MRDSRKEIEVIKDKFENSIGQGRGWGRGRWGRWNEKSRTKIFIKAGLGEHLPSSSGK